MVFVCHVEFWRRHFRNWMCLRPYFLNLYFLCDVGEASGFVPRPQESEMLRFLCFCDFLTPLCLFSAFWWLIYYWLFFISFVYLFFFPYFFVGAFWGTFLAVIGFLMLLFFLFCEFAFLRVWAESLFCVWVIFLGFCFCCLCVCVCVCVCVYIYI